jgi:sporulation protein YlmC with PRC-barrel domain
MSAREVRAEQLVGCRVRDAAGRAVGRIEELICEIELRDGGRDYVVTQIGIGSFGRWDWLAGSVLTRELMKKVGGLVGYRQARVRWDSIDLGSAEGPKVHAISTSTWLS